MGLGGAELIMLLTLLQDSPALRSLDLRRNGRMSGDGVDKARLGAMGASVWLLWVCVGEQEGRALGALSRVVTPLSYPIRINPIGITCVRAVLLF